MFKSASNGEYLVKVGDEVLLYEDLESFMGNLKGNQDSAEIVGIYIQNWAKSRLIAQKAKDKIDSKSQERITAKTLDYEIALLQNWYEDNEINFSLDTLILAEEISKYYQDYQSNFILHEPILKYRLVKTDLKVESEQKLKTLLPTNDAEKMSSLIEICVNESFFYNLNDSVWQEQSSMLSELPSSLQNNVRFGDVNAVQMLKDENYKYFLLIRKFTNAGEQSPLEYEEGKIKSLLLIKRKQQYLSDFYDNLYENAVKDGKIKIMK